SDRNVVRSERAGDGGEDAGLIGNVEQDVVLRVHRLDVSDNAVGICRHTGAAATAQHVARDVDDVADHAGSRGTTAGAAAVEHQLADAVPFHEHRVEVLAH